MRDNVTEEDGANPNAVSLFGQAANANDFPVLKAFQEYIDAEQAKARKRMLGLSIFFVILLVAVVITFTVVMMSIVSHNRELSDRLLDVAFRERQAPVVAPPAAAAPQPIVQPVVAPVVAPAQDSGIKPILEKLDALATAMVARQQQALQQPAPLVVTTAPAAVAPPVPTESAETSKMKETIKRQQAELEAERNRLKETEEKLRKAEIERHRRRLYPEYYAQQDAAARRLEAVEELQPPSVPPVEPKKSPLPVPEPKTVPLPGRTISPPKAAPRQIESPPAEARPPAPLSSLKPINYFAQSEDDDLTELAKSRKKTDKPIQSKKTVTSPSTQHPAPAVKKEPSKPETKAQPPASPKAASPSEKKEPPKPETKTQPPAFPKVASPSEKKVAPQPPEKKVTTPPQEKKDAAAPKKQPPQKNVAPPLPVTKTETLDIGTSSDNSIPWLIEERDL